MTKLLRVVVLLLALVAFAVTAAATDNGGADRPFNGTLAGSATFPADPSCPLGVRTVSEGSGTASHLGLISMASDHCFALPNLVTGGEMTFVAANGDELHMTYTGTSSPGLPSVVGERPPSYEAPRPPRVRDVTAVGDSGAGRNVLAVRLL